MHEYYAMNDTINPIVSVIIPCYNHGLYIRETINSVLANSSGERVEMIIVNDGSTDAYTNEVLQDLASEGMHVINQPNGGLVAARNTGIAAARGKYILPLDADNKVRAPYLNQAVDIMEANEDITVVHGDALYFGDKSGEWIVKQWSLQRIMLSNFIDACALIRKKDLIAVGLYQVPSEEYMGYEDWDLWIRFSINGYKFYKLNEFCFEYRVLNNSMVHSLTSQKAKTSQVLSKFYTKYYPFLDINALDEYIMKQYKKSPVGITAKLFLKAFMPKLFQKLVKKNYMHPHF